MPRFALLALLLAAVPSFAQQLHFDASAPIPAPTATSYVGGSSTSPSGHTFAANSRYLTLDGQPILPVMGEFHFSRVPPSQWDEQLLKMKSAGVTIVSTYIFWIHHEEIEGQFDWSGQRDLRRFIQACAAHHLYVVVRVGPWAHGEARNGGLPDWLLEKSPKTRRNDPQYLASVDRFYAQIGFQLKGLLWKDGGPIIGVQIENEYSQRGPGAGVEHLRTLKALALKHGLDVPFYTVTGWDRAATDPVNFLSVFGGYPDAPWDAGLHDLPPQEVYAFRFNSRVSGNMGAIGATGAKPAESATYDFPFITAEMGGGIEDTYHRRPVIAPDDIAAMMPVMLGSGVNLYGSYMFQGGINPDGKQTTLQESLATHYPNDLPLKSYDFQAPLGEFGDERPLLRKLKVFDTFLQDFGAILAPMPAIAPSELPSSDLDLTPPRAAIRTDGHSGFLFFNNYVRGAATSPHKNFQAVIKLKDTELRLPERPITLPSGTYGIWPFHLNLGPKDTPIHLIYATAELFAFTTSSAGTSFYFATTPGVSPEFVIAQADGSPKHLTNLKPSDTPIFTNGSTRIVLLTQQQAENAWKIESPSGTRLLLTSAQVIINSSTATLLSDGDSHFQYTLLPGNSLPSKPWQASTTTETILPAVQPTLTLQPIKPPGTAPPIRSVTQGTNRPRTVAAMPSDEAFETTAATWSISLPSSDWTNVHDFLLYLHYTGDLARLTSGQHLLDDNLYNGQPWRINLGYFRQALTAGPLQLSILPLPPSAPIFLEKPYRPTGSSQLFGLTSATLVPQYQLSVDLSATPQP